MKGVHVFIALKTGAALVAVAGLLALAGCGDDDDESAASSTSTEEEATEAATTGGGGGGGESVSVSLKDYSIDPADPTVEAGTVTFDVSNDGQVDHTIEVEGPNGEDELEPVLAPGDSGSLEVDLSKPGTYEWYCPVDDHADQGMEGEITVQ
jgi:uncharacterized cupredoxin-like copper-binding protein